jgi:hypothetical protein
MYWVAERAESSSKRAEAMAGCILVVSRMEESAFRQCRWTNEVDVDGSLRERVRTSVRVDVHC